MIAKSYEDQGVLSLCWMFEFSQDPRFR